MFDRRTREWLLQVAALAAVVIGDSGAPELARDLFIHLLDELADPEDAAVQRMIDWARRGGERARNGGER